MMHQKNSTTRKKMIMIIGVIGLVLFGIIFISLKTYRAPRQIDSSPTQIRKDPVSGEDIPVVSPNNKQYDQLSSNTPTFSGFSNLVPMGVSLSQIVTLEYAFSKYAPFAHSSAYISLAVNDLNPITPDPNDPLGRSSILSHVVVNNKDTYKVTIYYWRSSNTQLILYDAAGKTQLFDSGPLANTDIPSTQ